MAIESDRSFGFETLPVREGIERTVYHEQMLEKDFLARLPAYPASSEGRAFVAQLKSDLVALYAKFGAAHFQIGRNYPLRNRLDRQADALLTAIKAQLDPHALMNPGVLGLGG